MINFNFLMKKRESEDNFNFKIFSGMDPWPNSNSLVSVYCH